MVVKQLVSTWEFSCPISSATGFIGRFQDLSVGEKILASTESFTTDSLDDLETPDLRAISSQLRNGADVSQFGCTEHSFLT